MQNKARFYQRQAFSLLELVVVLFLIGILLGLLIPAVSSPRSPARRNQCAYHLRNLGLASIQYENTQGELPGWAMDYARPSSAHAEGVNVVMADGGIRFITNSIDMRVWQAIMTPAGEDVVPTD